MSAPFLYESNVIINESAFDVNIFTIFLSLFPVKLHFHQ